MSSTSSILCQISDSDRKPLAIAQIELYQKSNSTNSALPLSNASIKIGIGEDNPYISKLTV